MRKEFEIYISINILMEKDHVMKSEKNYTTYEDSDTDGDDQIVHLDVDKSQRASVETLVTLKHSYDFSDFTSFGGQVNLSTK